MEIIINGDARTVKEDTRLGQLLDELGLKEKVMAAAINMEIVKQELWDTHELHNGDRLELLDFVGGG
jgi:sulfur carrier protein